jgi:peptide/nickel transport system substrate-binding protein
MRRHWRKSATVMAATALVVTAASTAFATTEPPGTEPAGTEAAAGGTGYDESATCGTADNTSNVAKLEAPDPQTFVLTLCAPDPAIAAKVAFSSLQIAPSEYLSDSEGLVNAPIGTGPYSLSAWERGSQIVLEANADYWGDAPLSSTAVFQWNPDGAARLVQLQSGAADAIDNVSTGDISIIEGDANLQLVPRDPLNVFYVGFNVDMAPFDDPEVRRAIAIGIDRQRLIDSFYPPGSQAATQFLPPGIPGYDDAFVDFEYDPEAAAAIIAEKFPDGLDVALSYRDPARGYLPQPTPIATDIQAQLGEIGINVSLDLQESTTFLDNTAAGTVPFYLLGWGADFPDPSNFFDYHFGAAQNQFGTGIPAVHEILAEAGATTDAEARIALYSTINPLLQENIPMVPIAYGGSAMAYKAGVTGAHASPLTNESVAVMGIEGQDQFVFVQNGEPGGLYCGDETDGESLRVCEQISEGLLAYEVGGTESVPALAESWEPNEDFTVWTFHLREGVVFHDGSTFDATDVVESYRIQWDAADPRHVGRTGNFEYWATLFTGDCSFAEVICGFLHPPAPPEEEAPAPAPETTTAPETTAAG